MRCIPVAGYPQKVMMIMPVRPATTKVVTHGMPVPTEPKRWLPSPWAMRSTKSSLRTRCESRSRQGHSGQSGKEVVGADHPEPKSADQRGCFSHHPGIVEHEVQPTPFLVVQHGMPHTRMPKRRRIRAEDPGAKACLPQAWIHRIGADDEHRGPAEAGRAGPAMPPSAFRCLSTPVHPAHKVFDERIGEKGALVHRVGANEGMV